MTTFLVLQYIYLFYLFRDPLCTCIIKMYKIKKNHQKSESYGSYLKLEDEQVLPPTNIHVKYLRLKSTSYVSIPKQKDNLNKAERQVSLSAVCKDFRSDHSL